MLLPTHLLRYSGPSADSDYGTSVSYDYSGAEEIQKRQDEAAQQSAARYKALYDGDVAGSVASGHRIRDLLSSLKDIDPVRVSNVETNVGSKFDTGAFEGQHEQPQAMTKVDATPGGTAMRPASKRKPNNNIARHGKPAGHLMAGEPKVDPGLA